MNQKEAEVLALIRQNPYLSQQEMADRLSVSRPALANLISKLIRDGKILGRAYILPEQETVICIGGANVDRKFLLKEPAKMATSNPANVLKSVGGVARNIAENMGRLGHEVKLLSAAGRDSDWSMIEGASSPFMGLELTETLQDQTTGSYTAVLNPDGEMVLAMADMDVFDQLTPDCISRYESALVSASLLVADLNCPAETIHYLRELAASRSIPFAVIAVSVPKMERLGDRLEGITHLICNRDEAAAYTGREIRTEEDLLKAVQDLLDRGAEHAVVTAGEKGVMTGREGEIIRFPAVPAGEVRDVTGAGDAFSAALLHSFIRGQSFSDHILAGLVNASKTLESAATVRPELSANQLQHEMEELK